MTHYRTELLTLLHEQGWRVSRTEEDLEWWADEMWLLESSWAPVGSRAYVTFLVDPQFEGDRKKGEAVWAVMASPFRPVSSLRGEREFMVSLGQGWEERLPGLVGFLGIFRGVNNERP